MSNVDDLFSVFDEQNDDDNGPVPVVEPASSAPAKQPSNDAATSKKRESTTAAPKRELEVVDVLSDEEQVAKKAKVESILDDINLDNIESRIKVHTIQSPEACTHEVAVYPDQKYMPLAPATGKPAKEYAFVLDPFQKEAILCIENNQSVLVSAHTSAGKTVVAEYAIAKSLADKQRVIYTTPIKALSNQKYREFHEEFKDVGLVTGDVTINPSASCLIMTTEILRNMLYRGSEIMREVGWVIFDEIHYMRDKERGVVWEETLILLPDNVHYVFLSATIPNARQFAEWVCHLHKQPCHVVYTDYRPTPLQHYLFPAGGDGIHLVVDERGQFKEDNFNTAMNVLQTAGEAAKGDQKGRKGGLKASNAGETNIFKIVKMIMERSFAPVIIFSFSKKDCEVYAMQMAKLDFNSSTEKKLVDEVFNNAMDVLTEEDRQLPQVENVLPLLRRGIGIHHGGLLPILKETIEILFGEGLIKALFATETFAMGLNMPARTVLFTSPRKFDGKDFRWVTSGEYIQMSGRAGRRGLDDKGIVILMIDEAVSPAVGKDIVQGRADPINSAFHLTYNMVLNLLRVEEINPEYMLERSFFQFQNQSSIPEIYKRVQKKQKQLLAVEIKDEQSIISYHHVREQLDRLGQEFREYITRPVYLVPFLQPGRMIKIQSDAGEFEWGIIVNFKKENADSKQNPLKTEQKVVIDVLLHVADGFEKEGIPKPCPPGKRGSVEVVPVLHKLVSRISSLRVYYPNDLRPADNRRSVLKTIEEVKKRFPQGPPLLNPITDMHIKEKEFQGIVDMIDKFEKRLFAHPLHESAGLERLYARIYNIKKACGDTKSKPGFLSEKSLESSIKFIVKRFPNIDIKGLTAIASIKSEIIKSLSLYYYTFVDLLDFKDNVCEILTTMDALQIHLDITLNFELTKNYLDLVTTYVSLMILLSRVEDRKAVLGLFNAAYEMQHTQSDQAFPRLGQMIIDYDMPIKKLSEEFVPHQRLLSSAINSLTKIYSMRNLSAEKWRELQVLSLIGTPAMLLKATKTDTMSCEYISLETLDRWVIFGLMLDHRALSQQGLVSNMWISALDSSWVVALFRDEVIYIHQYIQTNFEGIKGYGKRISEVKECYNQAISKAALLHRERRKFLRTALKELALIMTDQPGLLGPKALLVFIGLCYARDEILWLLRHNDNPPVVKSKGKSTEDLVDRHLPELLFHMEELRALVRKYSQVMQRYYVQYLSGYDAIDLNYKMQQLQMCPEDESIILSSLYKTAVSLSVKQVEDNEVFDFRAFRLDWFRLQTFMSAKSAVRITDFPDLARLLDSMVFHTKMVDFLDESLVETSDLSIFCFYNKMFEDQFHMCLEFPAQNRYIIAFPLICSHFQNCTHEMCPEERHHIRERSLSVVNMFLDEMAKEAKNIITTICDEQCMMADALLPKHCAKILSAAANRKKKDKNKKHMDDIRRPGDESYRKTRELLTTMDKLHMALTELCYAINYCPTVNVWEYAFAPREYLCQHLETRFSRALVGMVMYSPDTSEIAKPSELLASVRAYMNVLQTVENYVHIDITRVFNNCLLQQTQPQDSHGEKTIAALYNTWYSDALLRKVSGGNIVFSLNQKAFVSISPEGYIPFNPEEFSDFNELRALAELIGPYGIKLLNESLMWHIANQVQELKRLVVQNKEVLMILRSNFDKPEIMKEQFKRLQQVDNLLQRMTIIGVILSFRQLAQEALVDVLEQRVPFLLSSIKDFQEHVPGGDPLKTVSEMASAAGLKCKVDPALSNALKAQKSEPDEGDHLNICLMMVFVAVSIPKLAKNENSFYRASLEAHTNNTHCMAVAINNIFGAMFTICGQNDIEDRMKEFLALASSSLLRLGQESDKEAIKNRESIYLLLDQIVQESPFLTMDLLESCFPYALIRNAYHAVYKQEQLMH